MEEEEEELALEFHSSVNMNWQAELLSVTHKWLCSTEWASNIQKFFKCSNEWKSDGTFRWTTANIRQSHIPVQGSTNFDRLQVQTIPIGFVYVINYGVFFLGPRIPHCTAYLSFSPPNIKIQVSPFRYLLHVKVKISPYAALPS
jgi:hypothetical protein